jgi:hypothetical protein
MDGEGQRPEIAFGELAAAFEQADGYEKISVRKKRTA